MSNFTMVALQDDGSLTLIKRGANQFGRTWKTIEDGKPVFVKHAVKVKDGVKGQWLKCVKNAENLHSGFETSQFVPVAA